MKCIRKALVVVQKKTKQYIMRLDVKKSCLNFLLLATVVCIQRTAFSICPFLVEFVTKFANTSHFSSANTENRSHHFMVIYFTHMLKVIQYGGTFMVPQRVVSFSFSFFLSFLCSENINHGIGTMREKCGAGSLANDTIQTLQTSFVCCCFFTNESICLRRKAVRT